MCQSSLKIFTAKSAPVQYKFYLYHQRDTRKPGPFGEPFGWDLATTSDFVHYEDKGVAIPRGTDEEQDQFIFAGEHKSFAALSSGI